MVMIGILVLVGLFGAYMWFGGGIPIASSQGESEIDAEYAGVLSDVTRLRTITLDTEILTSEKFRRLVVPTLPSLPNVTPGGRNPFLP